MTKNLPAIERDSQWPFRVVYACLLMVVQAPIWYFEFLPLQDYPNHLARMYLLSQDGADPLLGQYYAVSFSILPNLAMDLIVPALAAVFPVAIAGKLTIVLAIVLLTSGCVFVSYVLFRRLSYWPLVSFLLVFNHALAMGFVNFILGVGGALWLIGAWIYFKDRSAGFRVVVFNLCSSLLFFAHLYGFAFFVMVVSLFELDRVLRRGVFAWDAIARLLVVPAAIACPFVLYSFSATASGGEAGAFEFNSIADKFAFFSTLAHGYSPVSKWVTWLFVFAIPVLGLVSRRVQLSSSMLLSLGALLLLYFLMPKTLATSANADWRLLIPASLLLVSSLRWADTVRAGQRSLERSFAVLLIAAVLVQVALVGRSWDYSNLEMRDYASAIDKIEPGSWLFTANSHRIDSEFTHASSYAIIEKDAFVPSLFAYETQQPVHYRAGLKAIAAATANTSYRGGREIDWGPVLRCFDYVLLGREKGLKKIPLQHLEPVFKARFVTLYKVARHQRCVERGGSEV